MLVRDVHVVNGAQQGISAPVRLEGFDRLDDIRPCGVEPAFLDSRPQFCGVGAEREINALGISAVA